MTSLPKATPPTRALETALYAQDLEACADFYEQVIGLERGPQVPGRHVFFRLGDGMLLLFRPSASEQPPNNPAMPVPPHGARGPGHLCFAAEPAVLDAWVERLAAAGYPVEADFVWPNGARSIYFRDPAGNSIEFADPALWARD